MIQKTLVREPTPAERKLTLPTLPPALRGEGWKGGTAGNVATVVDGQALYPHLALPPQSRGRVKRTPHSFLQLARIGWRNQ